MAEKCDLSLILACYNEEPILRDSIRKIVEILNFAKFNYEIVFVDDYSKDKTREIINEIIKENPDIRIKKIFHFRNEGRGKTVADGFRKASGDVAGYIDVDLEVSPDYIIRCFLKINKGYDIVVGRRIYKFFLNSVGRCILSKNYPKMVSFICKTPCMDTESGYKFFKRDRLIPLLDEVSDTHWFWDTEIMMRAYYKAYKILFIPVLFLRRPDKKSTVRAFKDTFDYFLKLIRFRKEIRKENVKRNRD